MKRTLSALLAISTLAVALPAAAQPWRGDDGWRRGGQAHQLERRIDFLRERGELRRGEAHRLQQRVDQLQRLEWRYARDGLSRWERRDLDQRYAEIEWRLRREARDDDHYGWRDGYGRR
jgi:hypothetical protein